MTIPIKLTVAGDTNIPVTVSENQSIPLGVNTEIHESQLESYAGPYVATPSASTQTFPMYGKIATDDFVVDPIPSNYGLITWNGTVITVS